MLLLVVVNATSAALLVALLAGLFAVSRSWVQAPEDGFRRLPERDEDLLAESA
jgi:hypothetical protein